MTSLRALLFAVSVAALTTSATAATTRAEATMRAGRTAESEDQTASPPPRWVPGWLAEAFGNAIADATDQRDRHEPR